MLLSQVEEDKLVFAAQAALDEQEGENGDVDMNGD